MRSSCRPVDAVFFDLFGTLLSLGPLDHACDRLAPGRGAEVAARWRVRQLEASWLRTAMEQWAGFDVVTVDALRATLDDLRIEADDDVATLATVFAELPLVDGAADAVARLQEEGVVTGILTNASTATLARVAARLDLGFAHLLSVDAARRYKPHPSVYQLAVDATGLRSDQIGFVTCNGWDAAGAEAFGFRVAWLRPGPTGTVPAVGVPEPEIATWPELARFFTS